MPEPRRTIIIFSAFYEPYLSGAERFVQEVVERLGPRYRFVLFTARLSGSLPATERRPWGEIRRVGFGSPADKWLYPILAPLAAWRVDALVAHAIMESYAGIALWLFGFVRPGAKRILTLQSGNLDAKTKKIPRWLWRRIHASPTEITAISNFLAERAIRLGVTADRVRVIPNGVDLSLAESIRGEMIPRVAHRIVCVARLSPEKGIDALIRALPEVRLRLADAHLALVGDGTLRAQLETLAESLGIKEAVEFRGALANREALREIAGGEIFVCPSLAEGLGIVFIEAQAVETPAVGTRVGGIPDVIDDGRTGLLVPPADPSALASAIIRLFEDRDLARRLSSAALREIGRFDWNRIAETVAEVYEGLMGVERGKKGKMRKIVIAAGIYPPEIGGPATYAAVLSAGLAAHGFPVEMVSYGDATVPRKAPEGVNLRIVSRAGGPIIRYFRYFAAVFRAASAGTGPVYLLDPVSSGLPATAAAILRGKPTILKVVGDYAWEQGQARGVVSVLLDEFQKTKASLGIELLRNIQQWTAKRAARIIVPSRYLAGIVRKWGIAEDHIVVIPNAVRLAGLQSRVPGPSDRPPVVISAGRFLPWKGMETLVRCFPSVRERFPEARLVLVGDGPALPAIQRALAEVGGALWTEITGRLPQDKLHERIRQAAIFALVSGYEGFSHQIIEAMALGTPIVASNAGGNPEAIRDGGNGVLVPYGDVQRTAAALIGLLEDRARGAALAAAAREDAKQYTEQRMVEETIRVLKEAGA